AEGPHRINRPQDSGIDLPEIRVRESGVSVRERWVATAKARKAAELRFVRIPVVDAAEIELQRTEGRTDTAVQIDLGRRISRKIHDRGGDTAIELHVRRDVKSRLEISEPGGAAIGLRDTTEVIVVHDRSAEGDIPWAGRCGRSAV